MTNYNNTRGEEVDRKVGDEQALGPDQKVGTTCSSKTNNRLESGERGEIGLGFRSRSKSGGHALESDQRVGRHHLGDDRKVRVKLQN